MYKGIKLGVFIGRFSMFHNSHLEDIRQAADQSDMLVIFVGSANQRRSVKNPFTFAERSRIIYDSIPDLKHKTIILPANDYPYNDEHWKREIESDIAVIEQQIREHNHEVHSVTLFGFDKDASSFYLKMFKDWEFQAVVSSDPSLSSTSLRNSWFEYMQRLIDGAKVHIPNAMDEFLDTWEYDDSLQREHRFYVSERNKFRGYPYPETLNFVCADAVVRYGQSYLLVKRKNAPGEGCWALPGGFKNSNEDTLSTAIRELQEETNIQVLESTLRKSVVQTKLFDSPSRSQGIPRITNAVLFELKKEAICNPGDDAAECEWFHKTQIDKMKLYDDHNEIINVLSNSWPSKDSFRNYIGLDNMLADYDLRVKVITNVTSEL